MQANTPTNPFRHQPARGRALQGTFVTLGSMNLVEILSHAGFDYLAIDTQHAEIDPVAAARLLYAVPTTLPVLVRAPSAEAAVIGKLLDSGADGVIVPMINTPEQAAQAVAACRYSPNGVRSFGPLRRHLGREPEALEQRASCFVMIETTQAVENIAAIAATPGVTGVYVGPGDLAITMGLKPAVWPTNERLRQACADVAAACRRAGITAGIHGLSVAHVKEVLQDGFEMVTLSSDKTYLASGLAAYLAALRQEQA